MKTAKGTGTYPAPSPKRGEDIQLDQKISRIRPAITTANCTYSRMLELISSKWTVLIVYALEEGTVRYGELSRRIEGISKKMLTQTLRQLERDGFVKRDITPAVPPIVDYSLTPLGETLIPPLKQMTRWTDEHYAQVEQSRRRFDGEEVAAAPDD